MRIMLKILGISVCVLMFLAGSAMAQLAVNQDSAAAVGFTSMGGNTSWEELVAIGFDSQNRSIVGTISVKLTGGYNSNHVMACWADWNGDLAFTDNSWEYLGSVTRYTANPGGTHLPVFYGLSLPITHPPAVPKGVSYKVRCSMSWIQIITSSAFNPQYGNALDGYLFFDDIL
jgi:hypothetical protein